MASPKIHCTVVEVSEHGSEDPRLDQPQDLLPWADPYIAQLLVKHQAQLAAEERRQGRIERANRFAGDGFRGDQWRRGS